MATNYYVHGDTGNDGTGTGASGAPWKTLDKLKTSVADLTDCIVNLAGTFREATDLRDKGSRITIQQWTGQAEAWIRGDTVVTGWTANAGTRSYYKDIGAGLGASGQGVAAVVVNWDLLIDSYGQHYGFLAKIYTGVDATDATTVDTVGAGDNSFHYNNTTGRLTIRLGSGATSENPATYTVAYSQGGRNGLALGTVGSTAAQGIVWANLTFALWCGSAAGFGYGVKADTCQNSTGFGNKYFDCGYHSQGFTSYNGVPCRNNKEYFSGAWGIAANGDSLFVCYADTGGIDLESGFENCYGRLRPYLGRDGNPVAVGGVTSATVSGIICHTGGTNNVAAFTCRDCLISTGTTHSSMTNRQGAYRIANTVYPTNPDDWFTYSAKLIRCNVTSGVLSLFKDSAAWVWSVLDFSLAGSTDAARVTNGGVLGDNAAVTDNTELLWHGCDIRANLGIATGDHSMLWQVRGNSTGSKYANTRLIGCSVLNTSQLTTNFVRGFFNHIVAYNSKIVARQTIFAHRIAAGGSGPLNQLTYNNSTVTPSLLDFKDCYYVNVASTRYTSGSSYNTQTLFAANVDANGLYTTVVPYLDSSGMSPLELNYAGRSNTKRVTPNIGIGINGRAYDGSECYGAYQYGRRAKQNPVRNRHRWKPGSPRFAA